MTLCFYFKNQMTFCYFIWFEHFLIYALCNWSLLQPSETAHCSVFFVAAAKTIPRQTQLGLCNGGLQSCDSFVIWCNTLFRELKQCEGRSPSSFNRDASFSSLFSQFSWFSQYLAPDGYALFFCLLSAFVDLIRIIEPGFDLIVWSGHESGILSLMGIGKSTSHTSTRDGVKIEDTSKGNPNSVGLSLV